MPVHPSAHQITGPFVHPLPWVLNPKTGLRPKIEALAICASLGALDRKGAFGTLTRPPLAYNWPLGPKGRLRVSQVLLTALSPWVPVLVPGPGPSPCFPVPGPGPSPSAGPWSLSLVPGSSPWSLVTGPGPWSWSLGRVPWSQVPGPARAHFLDKTARIPRQDRAPS